MAKIAPEDNTPVTPFTVKLRADLQAKILAFGVYLSPDKPSSASYIVAAAFDELTRHDKEFAHYWETHKAHYLSSVAQRPLAPGKRGRPAAPKSTAA